MDFFGLRSEWRRAHAFPTAPRPLSHSHHWSMSGFRFRSYRLACNTPRRHFTCNSELGIPRQQGENRRVWPRSGERHGDVGTEANLRSQHELLALERFRAGGGPFPLRQRSAEDSISAISLRVWSVRGGAFTCVDFNHARQARSENGHQCIEHLTFQKLSITFLQFFFFCLASG